MRSTNPIAVGDTVVFERNSEDAGTIEKIQERKNFIARKSVNLSKESHIVASNLDKHFLLLQLPLLVLHQDLLIGSLKPRPMEFDYYRFQ